MQIIAAYLMMIEQVGHTEAICFVKRLKHDIQPNDGFQRQLQLWKVSFFPYIYLVRTSEAFTEGQLSATAGQLW